MHFRHAMTRFVSSFVPLTLRGHTPETDGARRRRCGRSQRTRSAPRTRRLRPLGRASAVAHTNQYPQPAAGLDRTQLLPGELRDTGRRLTHLGDGAHPFQSSLNRFQLLHLRLQVDRRGDDRLGRTGELLAFFLRRCAFGDDGEPIRCGLDDMSPPVSPDADAFNIGGTDVTPVGSDTYIVGVTGSHRQHRFCGSGRERSLILTASPSARPHQLGQLAL